MSPRLSPRPSRRGASVTLAALALAAAVAGCSSDSSDPAATSAVSPQPVTTPVTTPVTPTPPSASPDAGGTTSSGSAGKITADPCTLLDDKDITGAGGSAGVRKEDEFNGVFPGCNFGLVSLYVNVNESYLPTAGKLVSGVGDGATYSMTFHRLFVETGGTVLLVQLTIGRDDELDTLTTLAKSAVARL